MKYIFSVCCIVLFLSLNSSVYAAFPIAGKTVTTQTQKYITHLQLKKVFKHAAPFEDDKNVIISQIALAIGAIGGFAGIIVGNLFLSVIGILVIFAGYGFSIAGAVNDEEHGMRNLWSYTGIFILAAIYLIVILQYGLL